jgi:spore germination protein GerM
MTRGPRHVGLLAAVVLVLAVTTAACGIPTGGGPTAIAKNNVPFHLLSPSSPTTVGSSVPPASSFVPELIFLVATTQTVAPVSRDIPVPTTINATLTEVLGALLEGPTATESATGLETFLTPKTRVSAKVSGGVATVNFTTNPIQVVGANQTLAIAQVVFTATQQPGITGVLFEIAGLPIEVPTASGATIPGPVDRTSYQPQAPEF